MFACALKQVARGGATRQFFPKRRSAPFGETRYKDVKTGKKSILLDSNLGSEKGLFAFKWQIALALDGTFSLLYFCRVPIKGTIIALAELQYRLPHFSELI